MTKSRWFLFLKSIPRKLKKLGPGFITGAADDDPSGIATYSITGAQFGYKLNWLNVVLVPLMYAVQEMCARIGMVSGAGLAGAIKRHYSKKLLLFTVVLLLIANTINIGADLGAMAASVQMVTGIPFIPLLIGVTIFTLVLQVFVPYDKYSSYLKWMGLTLLVYGVTAIITKQDWVRMFQSIVFPRIEFNLPYFMTVVGFLGTSISPYLFFWQAGEEVEEQIKEGKIKDFEETTDVTHNDFRVMRIDTFFGMFFSQLMAAFVILTTTATLFNNGIHNVETPQQVAMALRPLAGDFAYLLFAVGIIGIGLQAVPILAGSAAYAVAEAFGFKEGLSKKLTEAKAFYGIIGIATIVGALMNLVGINPIKALYYTAIINGVIAVPLIFIIIRLASDKRVVGEHVSSRLVKTLGWIAFFFMGIASIFMIFTVFYKS